MTADHRSPHRHPAGSAAEPAVALRPQRLLTQNSELKRLGIWNWSIPALNPVTSRCAHRNGRRHRDQPPAEAGHRAAPASDTAGAGRTGGPETTP